MARKAPLARKVNKANKVTLAPKAPLARKVIVDPRGRKAWLARKVRLG